MTKRQALLLGTIGIMLAIAAIGQQKPAASKLLVLEWAGKAKEAAPPAAILIEMGLKDPQSKPWSGQAAVSGAKVVHREGYRFRDQDKLIEPNAWQASSHAPIRGPKEMPKAIAIISDRVATVGVVLHLADVKPDAVLTVTVKDQEIAGIKVPLHDVLAGKPVPLAGGAAQVRLVTTATPVVTAKTEDDFPAACYGPDGTLWVAYISYTVRNEDRRIEAPQLKGQPKDFKSYFQAEFGDQLFVKFLKDGKWSEPIAVTDTRQDLVRCAIAAEGNGDVWVVYSANRNGNYDVYARPISAKFTPEAKPNPTPRPGPEQKLDIKESGRHLAPAACTSADGSVSVAWQAWQSRQDTWGAQVPLAVCKDGKWDVHASLILSGSTWNPAVAASPKAGVATVSDIYAAGDYDIVLNQPTGVRRPIATSSGFEARPAIAYDPAGRLWIAYEEGPELWGKDYGALDDQDGNPLYFGRTVKVVCLEDGKLMRPAAELPPLAMRVRSPDTGQKVEAIPRYAYPKIGIDGKGRVWLTYRQKFGTRYSTHPGSYWLTFARRLDGDKWSEPIEVHHSDGLLDDRPVLLPHPAGGLRIIHNTDGRYTTPNDIDNQIYHSYVDLPGEPVEPKLAAHDPGKKDPALVERAKREAEAVQRIRDYRIDHAGKKLMLLRGEFHRHTEISWDGGPDGSLEDMFRYAIDAAGMDWIGNGDHDNGAGREYPWWLTQKLTDAYLVQGRFTPMHTYERSVSYPHGHRNCMFAQRGVLTLPRLAQPDPKLRVAGIHADDAKMLYRYLKEHNGICAIHTSATSMGTDWRDHDPVAEPIVEIYQGDRMSYEKEETPRAGYDPKSGKKPANIAGWYPLGYVDKALEKGHRLGFQSSSDHFSTHISYCVILADKPDRQAMLDAVKRRHVYGATDDIILDVKSGEYIMGDEFKTAQPPRFEIRAIGTSALERVVILKDSEVVQSFDKIGKNEFHNTWTDPKPTAGTHYYYVRVEQADGELAWGSPMWITFGK